MRIGTVLVAFAVARLTGVAGAQVPAQATWLNPTTVQQNPIALQNGDDVHVFSLDYLSDRLLYARSRDGGRTWPLLETPLGPYAAELRFTAAVAGPGTLLVLANDYNVGGVHWRSTDDGTTWSPTAPLFHTPGPGLCEVALLADGAHVVAICLHHNSGQLACRRSADGGATWLPVQVLDAPAPGSANSLSCDRNGNVIDVFWSRGSVPASGTVRQRSTDGGLTWLPAAQLLGPNWLRTASSDGTNLFVLQNPPTLLRSTDGGASWTPRTFPGIGFFDSVAQEGPLVVVVGRVVAPSWTPTYVVTVSDDLGLTWSTPLQLPAPLILSVEAAIAMGVVYVRFSPGNLLDVVTSHDAGASWQLLEGPTSAGLSLGPQRNVHLVMEGGPFAPTILLYTYVGLGSSVLGGATPGAGNVAPRLAANGLPFLGAVTTLQCTGAVGGSIGALAVSFAPPSPLPFAGGTVWPTVAPLLLAFATGGAPSQPGSGGFALPIAVPVHPALVGASFTSQAVVVDAAAAGGFALTNALETWLR